MLVALRCCRPSTEGRGAVEERSADSTDRSALITQAQLDRITV